MTRNRPRALAIPSRIPYLLLLILFLPLCLSAFPDKTAFYTVTGVIRAAETGRLLDLVNVTVAGTELGDASDPAGRFSIRNVPAGNHRLNFSHIGYDAFTQVCDITSDTTISVALTEAFFLMNEVVVTSTRTEKIHCDVPVATEVITRKDIDDSGALDLGELLSARSGVSVTTTITGESVISLNGMDSRYVLVLVDGQPVTGKFDGRVSLDQIPTAAVRKVEILKGPNSALYGSEAMGGVINIITEKPETAGRWTISSRFTGSDGRFKPLVPAAGRRNLRLDFRKQIQSVSLGSNIDINAINMDDNNLHINVDNIYKIQTRNQVAWKISDDHSIRIDLNYYTDEENNNTKTVNAQTQVNRFFPVLSHQWKWGSRWDIQEYVRATDYQRNYTQVRPWGTPVLFDNTKEIERELEINAVRTGERLTMNVGTEISTDKYSSNRIAGKTQIRKAVSLYGQLDFWLFPVVNAVVGMRLDRNNEVGTVINPRLAFLVRLGERWKLRTSVGRGFRMPTFLDQYIDWTHDAFGYRIEGNPNLKPEQSLGYTVGLDYYHPRVYQISIMLYGTRFNQLINDYVAAPNVFSYRNLDRVQNSGLEIQGRWQISQQMTASWGVNYVDNRDLETNQLIPNTKPFTMSFQWSGQDRSGNREVAINAKFIGSYFTSEYIPELGDFNRSKTPRRPFTLVTVTTGWHIVGQITVKGGIANAMNITDDIHGPFIGRQYFLELIINK